jgi:hypothetical protein
MASSSLVASLPILRGIEAVPTTIENARQPLDLASLQGLPVSDLPEISSAVVVPLQKAARRSLRMYNVSMHLGHLFSCLDALAVSYSLIQFPRPY